MSLPFAKSSAMALRPGRRVEDVVAGDLAADRQRAALGGDGFLDAAQLELRLQELLAARSGTRRIRSASSCRRRTLRYGYDCSTA